jgi:hypothetical protein
LISIFMPRQYSRLTLRITNAWLERLNDMTALNARQEGAHNLGDFKRIWDSIHGAGAWKRNPLVWAIGFEIAR